MKKTCLIEAISGKSPVFIAFGDVESVFPDITAHINMNLDRPGYELSLFRILHVPTMSFSTARKSNRSDARERPYLISHAFLVGGSGDMRESARFSFDGLELVFLSGSETGCEVWRNGECSSLLLPDAAISALRGLLLGDLDSSLAA